MPIVETSFAESLPERLAAPPAPDFQLYWLGQAGFVLEIAGRRLVVDPYLSDVLATKYAQTPYSHARMMPAPVSPLELGAIDLVLCTHAHTDHMDPGALAPLGRALPELRFVVPAASAATARERAGVGDDRLWPLDAGDEIEPFPGVRVKAFAAAHETIEKDERGRCRFLGYQISSERLSVYHSGDCVPYEGLVETLAEAAPDLALLPVNGRSAALRAAGFAGNFHAWEALSVCEQTDIPAMIAHHYDMFAFNTVDPESLDATLAAAPLQAVRARTQVAWTSTRS